MQSVWWYIWEQGHSLMEFSKQSLSKHTPALKMYFPCLTKDIYDYGGKSP